MPYIFWDIKRSIQKLSLGEETPKVFLTGDLAPSSRQIHGLVRRSGCRLFSTGLRRIFFLSPPVTHTAAQLDSMVSACLPPCYSL